jgi:hypothetical protein
LAVHIYNKPALGGIPAMGGRDANDLPLQHLAINKSEKMSNFEGQQIVDSRITLEWILEKYGE